MHEEDGTDDAHYGDDDVDVEVPAPAEVLGEEAAEQEPDRAAGTGDRAEDAEGAGTFLRECVKVVVSTASAVGASTRAERALERAGRDEHLEVRGGAADGGRHREPDEADEEGALPAEQVGEAAADEQQAAERERVRGDDPLAVAVG